MELKIHFSIEYTKGLWNVASFRISTWSYLCA